MACGQSWQTYRIMSDVKFFEKLDKKTFFLPKDSLLQFVEFKTHRSSRELTRRKRETTVGGFPYTAIQVAMPQPA
jgi:hypothetical protein